MPSMNVGMQRRIGVLPKTEDLLNYEGHIFGNTHRGFGMRNPTPTQDGFWGIGSVGDTHEGDGMLSAIYGNSEEGMGMLPPAGIYGLGQAAPTMTPDMMAASASMSHKPRNWGTPGLFGVGEISEALVKHQSLVAVLGLGMVMYMLK
tara:strand:+ start:1099 stop:1539 length:441 start_codon:yes stop_codon:yes gene_type:complete